MDLIQLLQNQDYLEQLSSFYNLPRIPTKEEIDSLYTENYFFYNDELMRIGVNAVKKASSIGIVVDPDIDGYTSASIMYLTLSREYPQKRIKYYLHTEKQHGITPDLGDITDIDLLIVPDAGSNDVEACKDLQSRGIDVLILDHHNVTVGNPHAIIINNKLQSGVPDELTGVAVTYDFICRLCDKVDTAWASYVNLGLIADGATLTTTGVYERYFHRGAFIGVIADLCQAICTKQNKIMNIHNIKMYVLPRLNAVIRVGSEEDKKTLLAFLICKANLNDVLRICEDNYKRQKEIVTKAFETMLQTSVQTKNFCVGNPPEGTPSSIRGLLAQKLASHFNKPAFVLVIGEDLTQSGSFRNCRNNKAIPNLSKFLVDNLTHGQVQGHDNAAGLLNADYFELLRLGNKEIEPTTLLAEDRDEQWFIPDYGNLKKVDLTKLEFFDSQYLLHMETIVVDVQVTDIAEGKMKLIGKNNQHLKIELANNIPIVYWSVPKQVLESIKPGQAIKFRGSFKSSTFKGKSEIQYVVDEIL